MGSRAPLIASVALVALAAAASLWGWLHISDGTRVAVHWAGNGKVNGWWPKSWALAFAPLLALGLTAVFAVTPTVMPRGRNLCGNSAYAVGWIASVLVLVVAHLGIVLHAAGIRVSVPGSTVFSRG